jgi:hypothetical protein
MPTARNLRSTRATPLTKADRWIEAKALGDKGGGDSEDSGCYEAITENDRNGEKGRALPHEADDSERDPDDGNGDQLTTMNPQYPDTARWHRHGDMLGAERLVRAVGAESGTKAPWKSSTTTG